MVLSNYFKNCRYYVLPVFMICAVITSCIFVVMYVAYLRVLHLLLNSVVYHPCECVLSIVQTIHIHKGDTQLN